jgi:ATP-binding cassette, subfamily B, bacterial MsbA
MFIAAIVAMAVYAASQTGFIYLTKLVTDQSFGERDTDFIRWIPLLIIGVFIMRGIAEYVTVYSMGWVGRQVIKRCARKCLRSSWCCRHVSTTPAPPARCCRA